MSQDLINIMEEYNNQSKNLIIEARPGEGGNGYREYSEKVYSAYTTDYADKA